MAAEFLARSSPRAQGHQADEIEHLRRRIQLRAMLIDYTFLQGGHRELKDAFTGDEPAGGFTVAEAIQALLADICEAASGNEKIMGAAAAARMAQLAQPPYRDAAVPS